MSHDVQIQFKADQLCFISLEKAQSALVATGFEEISPYCWIAYNPRIEVYLSVIGETGDSVEFQEQNHPNKINRIDTHVAWSVSESDFCDAWERRLNIAEKLGWVAYDPQTGEEASEIPFTIDNPKNKNQLKKSKKALFTERELFSRELELTLNRAIAISKDFDKFEHLEFLTIKGEGSLAEVTPYIPEIPYLQSLTVSENPQNLGAEIGDLWNLRKLQLNNNGMTSIPNEIGAMEHLESLAVIGNRITSLPESMKNLSTLEELRLTNNRLATLPEWLGELTALYRLDASDNKISGEIKIEDIENLENIEWLELGNHGVTAMPEEIWQMSSIRRLYLDSIPVKNIPDSVGDLTRLTHLSASNAELSSLPDSLFKLERLVALGVSGNPNLVLPDLIRKLGMLNYLWIENNGYETLPDAIAEMSDLIYIFAHGNDVRKLREQFSQQKELMIISGTTPEKEAVPGRGYYATLSDP